MTASFGSGLPLVKLPWSLQTSSLSTVALERLALRHSKIWFYLVCTSRSSRKPISSLTDSQPLGIGKFTIADDAIIQEADLGVNFFLDESCLGKSRALCCAEYLVELNPEVSGNCFPEEDVRSL